MLIYAHILIVATTCEVQRHKIMRNGAVVWLWPTITARRMHIYYTLKLVAITIGAFSKKKQCFSLMFISQIPYSKSGFNPCTHAFFALSILLTAQPLFISQTPTDRQQKDAGRGEG